MDLQVARTPGSGGGENFGKNEKPCKGSSFLYTMRVLADHGRLRYPTEAVGAHPLLG